MKKVREDAEDADINDDSGILDEDETQK